MRIVPPEAVEITQLTASNVPIDDYPIYDPGTPYVEGDRVVFGIEAWEALQSANGVEPNEDNALTWLRLGFVNRWKMFRDGRDSQTRQLNNIETTTVFDESSTTVALLGLEGVSTRVVVTDATEGVVYDQTRDIVDIGVTDWWEFFFLPYAQIDQVVFTGIPPYPGADIDITISAANATSEAACGRAIIGIERELGVTNYGSSVGLIDYSTKERDGFGNLVLAPRRQTRLANYDVTVQSGLVDFVQQQLAARASLPTLYIGDELYGATIVFGVYRDFTEVIASPSVSNCSIEVEGF